MVTQLSQFVNVNPRTRTFGWALSTHGMFPHEMVVASIPAPDSVICFVTCRTDHEHAPAGTATVSPFAACAMAALTADDEQLAALMVAACAGALKNNRNAMTYLSINAPVLIVSI
jgi:hypothetical protein